MKYPFENVHINTLADIENLNWANYLVYFSLFVMDSILMTREDLSIISLVE